MSKIIKPYFNSILLQTLLLLIGTGIVCSQPVITGNVNTIVCFGGNTGIINVTATGGTVPYTFIWSNGASSSALTGLVAGVYTVTVTDNAGAKANASFTVGQRPSLVVGGSVKETCPGAAKGAITLFVSGGSPGYSFRWSNGAFTENLNSLNAGSYTVNLVDSFGCEASSTFSIINSAVPTVAPSATPERVNEGNGTVLAANATAGSGSITTYAWNTGLTGSIPGGTVKPTVGTSYTVTVTNSNSCSASGTVMVNVIPNPSEGIKAPGLPSRGIK